MSEETLYTMALTRLNGLNCVQAKQLYEQVGSTFTIYQHREHLRELLPDATERLEQALRSWDDALRRAEQEMQFVERNNLRVLTPADDDYPQRLQNCPDAPLALYYRGNAMLNRKHVLSIVGTRRCTVYGQELTHQLCKQLSELCPDTLIVSGLAYGIDINAHRDALAYGFDTVAVLAHGLDQLYPTRHIETARQMVSQGGLLTEYMSQTNADKMNFVRRNRIVAGIADVTLVIESAVHGGSLITARLAHDYDRDVMAFPGPVGSKMSEGCNNLIRDQKAQLITNAQDLVDLMGWDTREQQQKLKQGVERQLFPDLTPEQNAIVTALRLQNDQQLNTLAVHTGLSAARLLPLLFELEMQGVVRSMAGGSYHLLGC